MGRERNPERDGAAARGELTASIVEGIARVGREQWNALLTPDDSPFLDWDWLNAMEESSCAARKTGWLPCHIVVRAGANGPPVGACPLYLKSHSQGEFVFDHGWAEAAERAGIRYFPKLMLGVPFTPHTGRRLLSAPGTDRRSIMDLLGRALVALCTENKLSSVHVNFCQPDEIEALKTLGFMERLGYQYHWRNTDFATFDDYLNRLKHKRRAAVRHERAALIEQGVTIRVTAGEAIEDSIFEPMFRLYLSTIEKLYWGRQYLNREFFELMRRDFKRHLCFVLAYRGPKLIAGTFCLKKAGVMYGRYWGCFEDLRFLHFNVCYYASIEHCIAEGIARFEPGAGGEYKWLRGFDPALTRSAHYIAHPGLRKAVEGSLVHERREVRAWIDEGREHSQLKSLLSSDQEQE